MDKTHHKDQVESGANISVPSNRRIIARQHTAKMLKMLRGYGPKESPPTAESQTAMMTEQTSTRPLAENEGCEPLAAVELTAMMVAEAKAPSYVRLVEESPDRQPLSPVAPAVPPFHPVKRSSTQHTVASLGEGLQQQPGVLGQLITQASELARSSRVFQAYLPPHLRNHAVLVRMDEEAWTVQTDSASWATRLRYKLYDIRQALGRQLGVTLPKPHIRVEPVAAPLPLRRSPLALTQKNAQLIEQTAHDESDLRLSAALHRLAQHTAPDDP